ncbi:MAG TPA: enoyl-CoA hydratase-related protein [Thermoanaerobaculia bacterium]|jgi:2-(1,2-epoxy-1,2-dihydrophenyl)acetyl-CoA isomerase|nr:enoyl-CoA hydratase-related protein [Thermoanaerobaculia bacterium]
MSSINSETRERVTTITLNRPEKLNAFGGTMREELLAALRAAEADPATRAIVITGAGRAFCAGGDVDFMSGLQQAGDVERFRTLLDAGRDIVTTIVEMPKPVIAAVNGVAAGAGCNLALACDYRIAAESARLGETFVRIGLHPDWGGTWLLPRLVGRGRAFELMATGRIVDAAEALSMGMVDRVVADLAAETEKLARAIAAGPPGPIADLKRALRASERNDIRAQLDLEAEHQLRAFRSRDAAEGMAAFFGKRSAEFRGD